MECNYKEIDRQLKEQFIHGLNDNYMLGEIIRELAKTEEGSYVASISLSKKSRSPKSPLCSNHQSKWDKRLWQNKNSKMDTETI